MVGKKLFTSRDVIDRKTDLIIQITPTVVNDNYTKIEKTENVRKFEDNTIEGFYEESETTNEGDENED